jgi:tetratricopeptide (TPR) repeat protein
MVYDLAPGWPISVGDKDKAYSDISNALKYARNSRIIYQQYAEILINDGSNDKALQVIDRALKLPLDLKFITEDNKCIRDLKADREQVKRRLKH